MKRRILVCAALLLAAGCAGGPRVAGPVPVETDAEYDALWQAALDAVTLRFHVASAEKTSGVIKTDYLVGALSKTGFKSNAVGAEAAREDFLHTIRRRAVVEIRRGAEPLAVRVEKERMIREHPDIVRGGTFSVGRELTGDDPRVASRWVDAGGDEALEAEITREIMARYRARISKR